MMFLLDSVTKTAPVIAVQQRSLFIIKIVIVTSDVQLQIKI